MNLIKSFFYNPEVKDIIRVIIFISIVYFTNIFIDKIIDKIKNKKNK